MLCLWIEVHLFIYNKIHQAISAVAAGGTQAHPYFQKPFQSHIPKRDFLMYWITESTSIVIMEKEQRCD